MYLIMINNDNDNIDHDRITQGLFPSAASLVSSPEIVIQQVWGAPRTCHENFKQSGSWETT